MAAPKKEGLDYFPFDVDLLDNDTLDYLREQYGNVVNDIFISLLTLLYRKKGYYIPYESEQDKKECIWYIYKRLRGGETTIKSAVIAEVIVALVEQGLFCAAQFPKVITSEYVQAVYYKATTERKIDAFDIIPDIWMLSDEQMRKLSKMHAYYQFLHQNNKSDDLPNKSEDLLNKSGDLPNKSDDLSQSKVKESKVKESKVKESKVKESKEEKSKVNESNFLSSKESKKVTEGKVQTYDEIFEDMMTPKLLKSAMLEFIKHLKANGVTMINSRLDNILVNLDLIYRQDDAAKVAEVRNAIITGSRTLPCEVYYTGGS